MGPPLLDAGSVRGQGFTHRTKEKIMTETPHFCGKIDAIRLEIAAILDAKKAHGKPRAASR